MTALTITKANVAFVEGILKPGEIAGEAFDAGDMVYLKASDSRWYKAQCDGTPEEAGAIGLAMALATADAAGARVGLAMPDSIVSIGAGVAGVLYVVGTVAGDLMPIADAASTNKVTPAALGIGSNKVRLCHVYNVGAVLA